MSEFVLDDSVVLAFLNQEPGAETAAQYLDNAAMSAVNLSEVIAKLAERGIPEELIREFFKQLNIKIVPVDKEQAIVAELLRPKTRALGLSLGDRICLALGLQLKQPIITTDRQWNKLRVESIEVRVVR